MSSTEGTPEEKQGGNRKAWLYAAAAVVVLVVAGVVVYLLTSGDDPDTAGGTGVPTITGSSEPPTTESLPPAPAPGASSASATATAAPPAAEDPVQARSVAEDAAAAISTNDVTTIAELACDPSSAEAGETYPADAKAEVVGEPKIEGDTATIDIRLTIGGSQPTVVPMPLAKQDGRWCIP